MTIKDVKALQAIIGDEYSMVMDSAHNSKGVPLGKHYAHLIKQIQDKQKEFPHRFKTKQQCTPPTT